MYSFFLFSYCRGFDCVLNVIFLVVEWGLFKGGFLIINRNLVINFVKYKWLNVIFFVLKGFCSDEEKKVVRCYNVVVREVSLFDGYEDGDWLINLVDDFVIDFVFGYGINFGE